MCQACQKPEENSNQSDCLDNIDSETLEQMEAAAQLYRERAAENDRIINQLIIGALILAITLAIFAIIWYSLLNPQTRC